MRNALSIDVEDYYQVSAFESHVSFDQWPQHPSRVAQNTRRILNLLDPYQVKATFFVLGWVAEREPQVVRDIQAAGHEIACHGYRHQLIYRMSRQAFRDDVVRAKTILEEITGSPVVGYRAPSYSIVKETLWALDVLEEVGFQYDSSIFPIHHDRYGMPDAPRFPYVHRLSEGRSIIEFPLSTARLCGKNLPVAGGGYFRIFPYAYTRWGLRRINHRDQQPAIFYLHPWEVDPHQPRLRGSLLSRFRHYTGLAKTEPRLHRLLRDFQFGPLGPLAGGLSIHRRGGAAHGNTLRVATNVGGGF
jgi:polysaccharide deacetylase family protein (PEP-CTERM system associated)